MGTPSEKLGDRAANAAGWGKLLDGAPGPQSSVTPGSGAYPAPGGAYGAGGPGANIEVPKEYLPYYAEASKETGIPAEVLIAQHRQESGFNPNARGKAGEIGIGQVMPATAMAPGYGMDPVDPATLTDPRSNIMFSARYLKARMRGDPGDPETQRRAFVAYNGGGDPNYVANVTRYLPASYGQTQVASGGAPTQPASGAVPSGQAQAQMTDQEWLAEQAKTYPSLAGPNTNMQAGTQPPAPVGVAARTGGTDVAGPGAGTAGEAPAPVPLAPPAPAPAAAPAPQSGSGILAGLTPEQVTTLRVLASTGKVTPEQGVTLIQHFKEQNAQRAQQQYENTRQAEADMRARHSADLADQAAARADAKAAMEQQQAGRPYQGTNIEAQDSNILLGGDDGSARYAGAFARQAAPKTNQDGSTVTPNMQAYDKPTYRGGKGQTADGGQDAPDYAQQGKTPPLQLTQDQARAATYADRMSAAHSVMSALDASAISWAEKRKENAGNWIGYSINSPDYQRVKQAQEDFVNATLRLESGAVINPDEFVKAAKQYFPQPGESAAVIEQKRQNREREIAGFVREAGRGYKRPDQPAASKSSVPAPPPGFKVVQ